MLAALSKNQNWAKLCPFFGIITTFLILFFFNINTPAFWAFFNIPLYMFHQTEEHLWPGGFKEYINNVINHGEERLTDFKVFLINILLVWLAFAIFGVLVCFNIGFGLLIVIFSIINCMAHIGMAVKTKQYNPGLVMATLQFLLSIFASYFITYTGLNNALWWWSGSILFSVLVHIILLKVVMTAK